MEVPSSFDESLVRNGRLHWTPYSRRRAREIYETAGIVRHVAETKKHETIRPFPRLRLFRVTVTGGSTMLEKPIVKKSYILREMKKKKKKNLFSVPKISGCVLIARKNRETKSEKFSSHEDTKP